MQKNDREVEDLAELVFRKDHIVEVRLGPFKYRSKDFQEITDNICREIPGHAALILVIAGKETTFTFDCIQEIFSATPDKFPLAKAYVVEKRQLLFIAQLCSSLYPSDSLIRFFENKSKAEAWLKELVS
jgi:hypothetical protein